MRPWYVILLAAVAAAVIVFGITQLGTPDQLGANLEGDRGGGERRRPDHRLRAAARSSPGSIRQLNFGTCGTLQSVNVKVGQHVKKGQLIASLDPSTAELTLEEAQDKPDRG